METSQSQRTENEHTESLQPSENGDSGASEPKFDVDYGKFYKQSYLKMDGPKYKKGPPLTPSEKKGAHFHRPENFSYQHVKRDFGRPMKKESSARTGSGSTHGLSMLGALGDTTNIQKEKEKKVDREVMGPMSKQEAIRLARFPDAHRHDGPYVAAIERPDWPGPPNAAAAYPELLREKGKKSHDMTDGEIEDDEVIEQDPETLKNIEELHKIQDSGVGQAVLKDLEKKQAEPIVVDPVSISRTPAADKEPAYKTRYESHIDASPSRFVDLRSRTQSMDDQMLDRKYRSQTLPVGNFPVERRNYEQSKSLCPISKYQVPRPGYSLGPKSATLPVSDSEAYKYEMENSHPRRSSTNELDRDRSYYNSTSSMEYDPETGLRRSRLRTTSTEGFNSSYLSFRRSVPNMFKMEEPPKMYSYDELRMTNPARPPGVDRNTLERHLEKEDFESIFGMTRELFYRLPEWKQNDLKKRVELF